jgi:hypothetical protein
MTSLYKNNFPPHPPVATDSCPGAGGLADTQRPQARPVYVLTLTPEGQGPPPAARLKALLKSALRCFGLRAVDVREDPQDEKAQEARPGER